MAIEKVVNYGQDERPILIPPITNIQLPGYALIKGFSLINTPHSEWHLRVDDLDSITLFFFGRGVTDHRWMLTGDNINNLINLRFYVGKDKIITYRWRESTVEEIQMVQNNPPGPLNIPRPSWQTTPQRLTRAELWL